MPILTRTPENLGLVQLRLSSAGDAQLLPHVGASPSHSPSLLHVTRPAGLPPHLPEEYRSVSPGLESYFQFLSLARNAIP